MISTNRRTVLLLVTIGAVLAAFSLVAASVTLYYNMPVTVTVEEQVSVAMFVDGSAWANNTEISFGTIRRGEVKQKGFQVHNIGTTAVQVMMDINGLPQGWDLTYNRNGLIVDAGMWLNGTVALTASADALPAQYFFTISINAVQS